MSLNVVVHQYDKVYGTEETQREITSKLKEKINQYINPYKDTMRNLDVYNMGGKKHDFHAGNAERGIIFLDMTHPSAQDGKETKSVDVEGKTYQLELLHPLENSVLIKSDNDVTLAFYNKEPNELNVLFDLASSYIESPELFDFILKQWVEIELKQRAKRTSWKHTDQKDVLTSTFKQRMERVLQENLRRDIDQDRNYQMHIEDYKRKIKQTYDSMLILRNNIEKQRETAGKVEQKLMKDLDLIVAHPKVDDLHIKGSKFIVHINNVICHDDRDRHFNVGNFRVEIEMERVDVRFFGDTPRRSHWTGRDPHPHVDGDTGRACLGNVSSTIAELCSCNEIYALVLVCIDFLESANTSDTAGRNVTNWERVNEDGTPYEKKTLKVKQLCHNCGSDDQLYPVYLNVTEEGAPGELAHVCESCRDEDYRFWESIGEYVYIGYDEEDYIDNEDDYEGDEWE